MPAFELQSAVYHLKKEKDLSWLNAFGKIFSVFDQTGSGCLGFGMEKDGHRFFMKIAGCDTEEGEVTPEEAIALLERAVIKYEDLSHPALIRVEDAFLKNDLFAVMFEWAEGDCLFDHWNFDRYRSDPSIITPRTRFERLEMEKKLQVCEGIISFLQNCTLKGYVPVDFYDSSVIYDFNACTFRFCDIDLFEKSPAVNTMGSSWWGTKRLKSPEEYEAGAVLDEKTAVFCASALCMDLLSHYERTLMKKRAAECGFIPAGREDFMSTVEIYSIFLKGVSYAKSDRWESMSLLFDAFRAALRKIS